MRNPIRIRCRAAPSDRAASATRTAPPAVTRHPSKPHTSKHSTTGAGGSTPRPSLTFTVTNPNTRISAPNTQPQSTARPKSESEIGDSSATATARGEAYSTPSSEYGINRYKSKNSKPFHQGIPTPSSSNTAKFAATAPIRIV